MNFRIEAIGVSDYRRQCEAKLQATRVSSKLMRFVISHHTVYASRALISEKLRLQTNVTITRCLANANQADCQRELRQMRRNCSRLA